MQSTHKYSFILRLWEADQSHTSRWHASVEEPETGKRTGFASLEQLFAYLMDFCELNCELNFTRDAPVEKNNES